MSVTIRQLNGDATFLLSFSPSFASCHSSNKPLVDYTVLVDPWLTGHSSIWHPAFQISHHTSQPAVRSLADLDTLPDLIVISQEKPDHCHKETLCTLPKRSEVDILAVPAAARKIRSWNHFEEDQVHDLRPYDPADPGTMERIALDSYSSAGEPGEITVANLHPKRDLSGLHNGIAFTYRAPTSVLSKSVLSSPTTAGPPPPTTLPDPTPSQLHSSTSAPNLHVHSPTPPQPYPDPDPVRIDSPLETCSPHEAEAPLSLLFTPHGLTPPTLQPYFTYHLRPARATPLTALLHSTTLERNPPWLGGLVASGAPGGAELVRLAGARCWVNAHDGVKDNKGWATKWIRTTKFAREEVGELLESCEPGWGGTDVVRLGIGEGVRVDAEKGVVGRVDRARDGARDG